MLDSAANLRRALAVDAANRHLPFVFYHRTATFWTIFRHPEFLFPTSPQIGPHRNNGGNDLACFFDQDRVADPNVFALDLIFVVQGSPGDGATAHHYRLERRDRRQRSGATDLHQDVYQPRFHSFGLVLVGDRPARRFRGEAEDFTLRKGIDFHDRAVGLIREIVPDSI